MFAELLSRCDTRYMNRKKCDTCISGVYCPDDCSICLERIHYPKKNPKNAPKRKYDCSNMADYYFCKYSNKYVSELIYAYRKLNKLKQIPRLTMMSFGCGPCSDLLAIDYLSQIGTYKNESLSYYGLEYCCKTWDNIYRDLQNIKRRNLKIDIFQVDNCESMEILQEIREFPKLITFNYVFSDMKKNTGEDKTIEFIKRFVEIANKRMTIDSFIVLNDIKLTNSYGGGLDFFKILFDNLKYCKNVRIDFQNDFSGRGDFNYGENRYPENKLIIPITINNGYEPYRSCSSGQMIIKKVK